MRDREIEAILWREQKIVISRRETYQAPRPSLSSSYLLRLYRSIGKTPIVNTIAWFFSISAEAAIENQPGLLRDMLPTIEQAQPVIRPIDANFWTQLNQLTQETAYHQVYNPQCFQDSGRTTQESIAYASSEQRPVQRMSRKE